MAKLQGKGVLITGAAHGIGRRMANLFASAGCQLILTDIDKPALEKAQAQLREKGCRVAIYSLDVSKREEVEAMAADVIKQFGGLDIIINNAGIGHNGELVETSIETWQKLMDVNFWGPLYHVYAFLPHMMRAGSGHIVNVSSGQAFFRLPTWGPYAIIKLALGAFSELLRIEVRQFGIKVTTVYPFMIQTGFYKDIDGETLGAKLSMKLLPLYSMSPERVARIIFKAVKKQKPVEMVSVFNNVAFAMRSMPPVANIVSWFVLQFLGKDKESLIKLVDQNRP